MKPIRSKNASRDKFSNTYIEKMGGCGRNGDLVIHNVYNTNSGGDKGQLRDQFNRSSQGIRFRIADGKKFSVTDPKKVGSQTQRYGLGLKGFIGENFRLPRSQPSDLSLDEFRRQNESTSKFDQSLEIGSLPVVK